MFFLFKVLFVVGPLFSASAQDASIPTEPISTIQCDWRSTNIHYLPSYLVTRPQISITGCTIPKAFLQSEICQASTKRSGVALKCDGGTNNITILPTTPSSDAHNIYQVFLRRLMKAKAHKTNLQLYPDRLSKMSSDLFDALCDSPNCQEPLKFNPKDLRIEVSGESYYGSKLDLLYKNQPFWQFVLTTTGEETGDQVAARSRAEALRIAIQKRLNDLAKGPSTLVFDPKNYNLAETIVFPPNQKNILQLIADTGPLRPIAPSNTNLRQEPSNRASGTQ